MSPPGDRRVAVFGSSEPRPDEPLYRVAVDVGRLLAERGYAVVTGGYGGVMEGASRGAREAGGRAIGVTCAIFDRTPNAYLVETVESPDLHIRTRELIDGCDGFVVLEGKAGTLAELALLWALQRAGCLSDRRVVVLGARWKALVETLERLDMLEPPQLAATHFASTPAEAVRLIEEL